jgi:hypothetical protein
MAKWASVTGITQAGQAITRSSYVVRLVAPIWKGAH